MKIYDLVIIGSGPAGAMAAASIKGMSILMLEKGLSIRERRDLACGWFGHGIYAMDRLDGRGEDKKILDMCRAANGGKIVQKIGKGGTKSNLSIPPNTYFSTSCGIKIAEKLNDTVMEKADVIFGTEVKTISTNNGIFSILSTSGTEFKAYRCLLATGGKSAEWILEICSSLDLSFSSPGVKLGARVEIITNKLKKIMAEYGDVLIKDNNIECNDARFGGFVGEWDDFNVISAFGHSIPGKQSEKTNFMIGYEPEGGFKEALRLTKIVNVLSNDKVRVERVADFLQDKSIISKLDHFRRLSDTLRKIDELIPMFTNMALIYFPEIKMGGALPADENMRTEVPRLYGAGQCVSGVDTLFEAMISGQVVSHSIMEDKENE
jgi:uncharacterized FAD-dependent dehydrogenase